MLSQTCYRHYLRACRTSSRGLRFRSNPKPDHGLTVESLRHEKLQIGQQATAAGLTSHSDQVPVAELAAEFYPDESEDFIDTSMIWDDYEKMFKNVLNNEYHKAAPDKYKSLTEEQKAAELDKVYHLMKSRNVPLLSYQYKHLLYQNAKLGDTEKVYRLYHECVNINFNASKASLERPLLEVVVKSRNSYSDYKNYCSLWLQHHHKKMFQKYEAKTIDMIIFMSKVLLEKAARNRLGFKVDADGHQLGKISEQELENFKLEIYQNLQQVLPHWKNADTKVAQGLGQVLMGGSLNSSQPPLVLDQNSWDLLLSTKSRSTYNGKKVHVAAVGDGKSKNRELELEILQLLDKKLPDEQIMTMFKSMNKQLTTERDRERFLPSDQEFEAPILEAKIIDIQDNLDDFFQNEKVKPVKMKTRLEPGTFAFKPKASRREISTSAFLLERKPVTTFGVLTDKSSNQPPKERQMVSRFDILGKIQAEQARTYTPENSLSRFEKENQFQSHPAIEKINLIKNFNNSKTILQLIDKIGIDKILSELQNSFQHEQDVLTASFSREKGVRNIYTQIDTDLKFKNSKSNHLEYKRHLGRYLRNIAELIKLVEKEILEQVWSGKTDTRTCYRLQQQYDVNFWIATLKNLEENLHSDPVLAKNYNSASYQFWSRPLSYALAINSNNRRDRFGKLPKAFTATTTDLLNYIYLKNYKVDGAFFAHLTENVYNKYDVQDLEFCMSEKFSIEKDDRKYLLSRVAHVFSHRHEVIFQSPSRVLDLMQNILDVVNGDLTPGYDENFAHFNEELVGLDVRKYKRRRNWNYDSEQTNSNAVVISSENRSRRQPKNIVTLAAPDDSSLSAEIRDAWHLTKEEELEQHLSAYHDSEFWVNLVQNFQDYQKVTKYIYLMYYDRIEQSDRYAASDDYTFSDQSFGTSIKDLRSEMQANYRTKKFLKLFDEKGFHQSAIFNKHRKFEESRLRLSKRKDKLKFEMLAFDSCCKEITKNLVETMKVTPVIS